MNNLTDKQFLILMFIILLLGILFAIFGKIIIPILILIGIIMWFRKNPNNEYIIWIKEKWNQILKK